MKTLYSHSGGIRKKKIDHNGFWFIFGILLCMLLIMLRAGFANAQSLYDVWTFENGTANYELTQNVHDPGGSAIIHSFTPDDYAFIETAKFRIKKDGGTSYSLYLNWWGDTVEIPASDVGTSYSWVEVDVPDREFEQGVNDGYWFYITETSPSKKYSVQYGIGTTYSDLNSEYERFNPNGSGNGWINAIFTGWKVTTNYPDWTWLKPLIPIALATTTCEFISSGNTTTAECSDPEVKIPLQNIALGLFLFGMVFFGLLFYFKK